MLTAELKEYLGMMADLERDLYTQLKIEELIHKKMGEYYVLPVERTYEEYCKNHFYDTTLPMLPNGDAPIKPLNPKRMTLKEKISARRLVCFFSLVWQELFFRHV